MLYVGVLICNGDSWERVRTAASNKDTPKELTEIGALLNMSNVLSKGQIECDRVVWTP
jgi:hypothetical protein